MGALIVIYVIIGIIAGFIGDETEEQKNWSYGIIGISLLISLVTFGPWVIAAFIETVIGFFIGKAIKENLSSILTFITWTVIIGIVIFSAYYFINSQSM